MTLSFNELMELTKRGRIRGVKSHMIQPASMDIQLSEEIYRMPSSLLPRPNQSVSTLVRERSVYKLTKEQPLELGFYYLIKSKVSLNLPSNISGSANNKSSSGRINLQSRLILDGVSRFDFIPAGYSGEVWVEVHPELCSVYLDWDSNNNSVNQMRLRDGDGTFSEKELRKYHEQKPLLYDQAGNPIKQEDLGIGLDGRSLLVAVNLNNSIGFKGIRRSDVLLSLSERTTEPSLFFERIQDPYRGLVLKKDEFYILASLQKVSNPLDVCINMLPYQAEHGEFRSHFAGFFDPGNGYGKAGEDKGFSVTMEVIPMENAIELQHAQPMFSIQVEKLTSIPSKVYGMDNKSNYYCNSGPKLAKYFRNI